MKTTFKFLGFLLLGIIAMFPNLSYSQDIEKQLAGPETIVLELKKDKKGMKVGAAEGRTLGKDSVQLFTIKPLNIMEPVYVSVMTKFPQFPLDLTFYGNGMEKPSSTHSTDGKKSASHIFRTQGDAVFGVSSKTEGAPYLVSIMVGKQLPISSTPLVRITDDIEEYNRLTSNLNISAPTVPANLQEQSSTDSGTSNNSTSSGLLYGIIGFLVAVILIGGFLFFKKGRSNSAAMLLILGSLSFGVSAQEQVFILEPNDINATVSNYTEQVFILDDTSVPVVDFEGFIENSDNGYASREERNRQNVDLAPGVKDISGTPEADEMGRVMKEERQRFEEGFYNDMPGRFDDKDNNSLPPDMTQEEIDNMRRRIAELERQVALLSERDEDYLPDDELPELILYCPEVAECVQCYSRHLEEISYLQNAFLQLKNIYSRAEFIYKFAIERGNALANSVPGLSLGWEPVLNRIQQDRRDLAITYVQKFEELMGRLRRCDEGLKNCNEQYNPEGRGDVSIEMQAERMIEHFRATAIPTPF